MKRNGKIVVISALTAFSMIAAAGSTIAWFSSVLNIDMSENVTGKSSGAYFASGTGAKDEPYIINNPVHLYNLAWLQYLGYFNDNTDALGATSGPTYFEIDDDLEVLDMTNWILPPIGTTINPFIGSFNGNGVKIANLTTINSTDISDYPNKPYPIRNGDVAMGNINVVGMFGVIGTNNLTMPTGSSVKYPTDYPTTGYEDNKVTDFTIDNGHVINYQSTTIAGIVAGYVNAPLTDVGITSSSSTYPSSIDLSESTSPTPFGGKTNISDFTSVGFCEPKFKTDVSKKQVKIYDPISSQCKDGVTAQQSGETVGWGGSVDMESMYNRIEDIQSLAENRTIPINEYNNSSESLINTDTNTIKIQFYHDDKVGSFVWYPNGSDAFNGNFNYLGGGIQSQDDYYNIEKRTGYRIHSGTNYLDNSVSSLASNSYTANNVFKAAVWTLSTAPANGSSTTISIKIGNSTYYLRYNSGLQLSTTTYSWTYETNGNGFRLHNGNNRYLRNNNGWTTTTTQNQATSLTFEQGTFDYATGLNRSSYNYNYSSGELNTYFPLIANSDNTVTEKNTGYVISGSSFINPDETILSRRSGDIRVSKYATSDISSSYSTRNKTLTNVYTINASGARETIGSTNSFTKYETSKKAFLNMISGGSIYGLHFMDGAISTDKLVTAPYALINGKEYTNYKLPADSVDFNLEKKGVINFFAGTYFSGNNSFFSLHSIERDDENNITSIKEIAEILSDGTARNPYVYKYTDGSYSQDNIAGYNTVLFKTSQIKKQSSLTQNAVYYFEIPVNAGEFALGSVDGGTGAYLMYLDIGTNATTIYRSTVVELIEAIAEEFSRPLGVGIVAGTTSVDDANSYCITIKSTYNGVVTVARSSDTEATYTETTSSDLVVLSYAYDALNVNGETAVANSRTEVSTTRVTYFDYTPNDNSTTETIVSSISTKIGSAAATTNYEIEQYKGYPENMTSVEEDSMILFDDAGFVKTITDFKSATFFSEYEPSTTKDYDFVILGNGTGTITVNFSLTTNKGNYDECDLFNARGYEITVLLTDTSGTSTDITSQCMFFAKDSNTYVVDTTTNTLILVINENFVLNDVSPSSTNP